MKKNGILNRDIAAVLARLGHTDTIVISDCGLPIPDDVYCIDLSLELGSPSFIDVLETIRSDMKIEHITLAKEIKNDNPLLLEKIDSHFPETKTSRTYCEHDTLKQNTSQAKVIIRTGEATPFANMILQSAVIF